jgi:hypothetical protein
MLCVGRLGVTVPDVTYIIKSLHINLSGGKSPLCTLADDVVRSCRASQFLILQTIKNFMGPVCTTLHRNEVYERIILPHNVSLRTIVTRRHTGSLFSHCETHARSRESEGYALFQHAHRFHYIYGRIIQNSELLKSINKAAQYN